MFYNFHMAKYSIRTVKEKKEIVAYHKKHGWIPTIEKYNISRSTIVHWLERIKKADKSNKNPLERSVKRRTVHRETALYVVELRKKYPTASYGAIRDMACKKQKISRTTVWHILQGHWPL